MEKKSSRTFWFTFVGGLLGAFLTSWLAPKAIAWYFDPPVNIGVNCKQATEWSMAKLQTAQLTGLGLGAACGLVFSFLMRKRNTSPADTLPIEPQP